MADVAADPRNMRSRYLLITDRARLGGLSLDLQRPEEARTAFERVTLEDLRKQAASPAKFMDERLQPRR